MSSPGLAVTVLFGYMVVGNFACAVISAKWALDLGLSGPRQALWALGGIIFGPLALLDLYLKLRRSIKDIPEF
jgi:hypothetical protein